MIKVSEKYADTFIVKENLMQNLLPQTDVLVPNTHSPQKAVEYINSYINKVHCENLSVNISFMNAIDACYVSTMCSANHYINYPDGSINWIVSSNLTKELANPLNLGNAEFVTIS